MTVVELAAARETLQAAIYSGQLRVKFSDGREIMYQSISEMRKALELLDTETAQASETPANAPRTSYVEFSRD